MYFLGTQVCPKAMVVLPAAVLPCPLHLFQVKEGGPLGESSLRNPQILEPAQVGGTSSQHCIAYVPLFWVTTISLNSRQLSFIPTYLAGLLLSYLKRHSQLLGANVTSVTNQRDK